MPDPEGVRPVIYTACVLYPPLGWVAVCGTHGQLPTYWTHPARAAFDALGHATHHHTRPSEPVTPPVVTT